MDKLEKYLDQVCRGIGGPVEMRQHVRQELREHLLDAVAQHEAAGLAEDAAIDKAIEEFGKPDEVRTELEAAHGQRMTWIIDKAMQWKEMTMKAKWLWMTWAHLGLAGVIALEALFITFNVIYIIPKFRKLVHDGFVDLGDVNQHGEMWMVNFLDTLSYTAGHHTIFWVLVPAAAWGLFEWRVRSDNKPFMRLSGLGTVAVGLMIVVMLMAGSLVTAFCLGIPALGTMTRPWAEERVADIDASFNSLEKAAAQKDWPAMQEHANQASNLVRLLLMGPAVTSLGRGLDPDQKDMLRVQVGTMKYHLDQAQKAIAQHQTANLDKAMADFRIAFAPVRTAAKRPAR